MDDCHNSNRLGFKFRVRKGQKVLAEVTDFTATDCGSIIMLCPKTDAAKDWCAEHLPEDAQWLGGSVAIEHRYFGAIAEGITADGLEVR
jgi:hypothetical protein